MSKDRTQIKKRLELKLVDTPTASQTIPSNYIFNDQLVPVVMFCSSVIVLLVILSGAGHSPDLIAPFRSLTPTLRLPRKYYFEVIIIHFNALMVTLCANSFIIIIIIIITVIITIIHSSGIRL